MQYACIFVMYVVCMHVCYVCVCLQGGAPQLESLKEQLALTDNLAGLVDTTEAL